MTTSEHRVREGMSEIPDGEPQKYGRDFEFAERRDSGCYTWGGAVSDVDTGFMGAVAAMVISGPPMEVGRMPWRQSVRYRVGCVRREFSYRFTMAVSALKGEL